MSWRAGSSFALLTADGEQSLHASGRAVVGEFAIIPPLLGSSQRLLNRDHYSVYYKVSCQDGTASPNTALDGLVHALGHSSCASKSARIKVGVEGGVVLQGTGVMA